MKRLALALSLLCVGCATDITAPPVPERPRYATAKGAATGKITLEIIVVQVVGVPPKP